MLGPRNVNTILEQIICHEKIFENLVYEKNKQIISGGIKRESLEVAAKKEDIKVFDRLKGSENFYLPLDFSIEILRRFDLENLPQEIINYTIITGLNDWKYFPIADDSKDKEDDDLQLQPAFSFENGVYCEIKANMERNTLEVKLRLNVARI